MFAVKIAVVGAGIAGLSAAWLLSRRHDVVLFEREMRLGGHANTFDAGPGGRVPVDTGFIVYNTQCYPNLVALFEHLKVPTAKTEMSFAVSLDGGAYEYNGNGVGGYFGQRSNLASPRHWRMAADIVRFFRMADDLRKSGGGETLSLGRWLEANRFSRWFVERHIVPMGAAIWSTPSARVLDFPALAFVRFFANHGLLQMSNRPEWRTVVGGSRTYVRRVVEDFRGTVAKGDAVVSVLRGPGGVTVRTADGHSSRFDRCLIACHADEALSLLTDADADEKALLGAFGYSRNDAVLHTDPALMPRRKHVWSSWNYRRGGGKGEGPPGVSLTYWMNRLQPLDTDIDFFVSINPDAPIAERSIVVRLAYSHPVFDGPAIAAQRRLWSLQGRRRTWFAGSYFAFGFHEDALQAGLAAAEEMGDIRRPWDVEGQSDRLQLPSTRVGGTTGMIVP
ncbi:MAG: NAD(P)/FAD-dependent oxidoreductase [Hyphomicrobium sp.]